jgi:predicted nucleic acid-binding protein
LILADTSVWIDHFRIGDATLQDLLHRQLILMHPFVVAELALGNLPQRSATLKLLEQLPGAPTARLSEVRHLIESRSLFGRGIGLMDAHLLASVLIQPPARLWTRDKRLDLLADHLSISAGLA